MKLDFDCKEIKIYKFIDRYELSSIELEHVESFSYVIDVYKDVLEGLFFPKVYRREFFRMKPSFSSGFFDSEQEGSDEEILVEDMAKSWSDVRLNSSDEVVLFVLKEIFIIFDFYNSK